MEQKYTRKKLSVSVMIWNEYDKERQNRREKKADKTLLMLWAVFGGAQQIKERSWASQKK